MKVGRSVALCLLALALLLCSGCMDWALPSGRPAVADPEKYRAQFSDRWCYSRLPERLRPAYGSVYTALTDGFARDETVRIAEKSETTIGISIRLPEPIAREEAETLYTAVLYDHPSFFYVSGNYFLSDSADGTVFRNLTLCYSMDAAARRTARAALESAVEEIRQQLPIDPYDRELYLYDRLMERCSYDAAAAAGTKNDPQSYTAYGALVVGKAVCEGYARALQLLLTDAGLTGVPVTGFDRSSQNGHMWNLVQVNGALYYLDATYDDTGEIPHHRFFNITTQQLLQDRTIDDSPFWGEECTATADNYYVRQGTYVDTYQRQAIAAMLAARLRQGDTSVELRFAPDKFANGLLFLKNSTQTLKLLNPLLADTGRSIQSYRLYSAPDYELLTFEPD